MRSKIYLKLILFVALIFTIIVSSQAGAFHTKRRIYDFAGLLNGEEIEELESISEKYSAKRETDFIILTYSDPKGKDIVEYMQDFYDEEALGYDKPHGNAAILTVDMKNREVYLAGFYKGEKYLDDYRLDLIRDKITSDLSRGDYFNAFHTFIKTSYKYMGIRPGVNPNNILFNLWFQIAASLGIAGIAVGIMALNSGGRITVNAATYQDSVNTRVIDRRDIHLRTTVTKRRKPSNNKSNSGGGSGGIRSGGGVTKGGHSHSGSRGKF